MAGNESDIILFDGVCNLCNGAVQFVIKRDPQATFKFASLQSERGQALLRDFDLSTREYNTFVYIHRDRFYIKSSAALHVLKELGGFGSFFMCLSLFPKR